MRRVLVVSPHFPPVNAPDMQRARLALPHLRALGWEPVVLAVSPDLVEGAVREPMLEKSYPADVRVVRVGGVSPRLTRPLGFGSLWLRCGRALRRAGDELLAREKFDLVFFTTTQFDAFALGPRWLARHGVPYVLDYQDPWVNDYYRRAGVRPPGGPLRYWFSQYTARRREPAAVRSAAAIVSVSSAYGPDLLARHPDLDPARIHHLPFGSSEEDVALARLHRPADPLVSFDDGLVHLVYTGRCGPDMRRALGVLFRALRLHREARPEAAARLRLHFIGTDYAPPPLARPSVLPVAAEEGVADLVAEHPGRVPYYDALHYLARADTILLVGSDDPTYSASKLFPCLLARRPLLLVAHPGSLMLELALAQGVATAYGFPPAPEDFTALAAHIRDHAFHSGAFLETPVGAPSGLDAHTAAGMTRRLAAIFDASVPAPSPT